MGASFRAHLLLGSLCFFLAGSAAGADLEWKGSQTLATVVDSVQLESQQVEVHLAHAFIDTLFEVRLDGEPLSPEAWRLDARLGRILLDGDAVGGEWLRWHYRFRPSSVLPRLQLFSPLAPASLPDSQKVVNPPLRALPLNPASRPERAAGDLDIRGSKTVSVQGGTRRDVTVDQGLRLSISGLLAEGLRVRAEISDENLPITPQGNSENLGELDQVRIELLGSRGSALVGDFRLEEKLSEFAPLERKLQGLRLRARHERGTIGLLGGSPKGRRVEIELRGRDGKQGPYELLDPLRLDQSVLVAGSERVWLDDEELRRGEGNDYTIDYVRGEIRFTARRPIGNEQRIAVDYEVSDQAYSRSVLGVRVDSLSVGPALLHFALVQEGDDPDRPRSRELTAVDLDSLRAAGDRSVLGEGARMVEIGEGDYRRLDDGSGPHFALADSGLGDWDVDFLHVGEGAGDYRLLGLDALGRLDFRYEGLGGGDHVVGRRLRAPRKHQLAVARAQWGNSRSLSVSAEANFSREDLNQFSSRDNNDNGGHSWRLQFDKAKPVAKSEGGWGGHFRSERIGPGYQGGGRLRTPFFYNAWNLQGEGGLGAEQYQELELLGRRGQRRASVRLSHLALDSRYGGLRGSLDFGGPLRLGLYTQGKAGLTRAERSGGQKSNRKEARVDLWRPFSFVEPFGAIDSEELEDLRDLSPRGYRQDGWEVGLRSPGRSWSLLHGQSLADSLRSGDWQFTRDSRRWELEVRQRRADLLLEGQAQWRETRRESAGRDRRSVGRLRARYAPPQSIVDADFSYRIGSEEARVLGRQVVFVGIAEGDFDAEGNPVGPRQGDYDLVFSPTDSTQASTEVGLDLQLGITPPLTFFGGMRATTRIEVIERSRSEDLLGLALLDPALRRRDDLSVLGEQQWRQELQLLRGRKELDLRLRFDEVLRLDQRFAGRIESSARRLREATAEGQFNSAFGWVLRTADERRQRSVTPQNSPLQAPYRVEDLILSTQLRWRPSTNRRISLELRRTARQEGQAAIEQELWELRPSGSLEAWRARWTVSARYADISETAPSANPVRPFFFEAPGVSRSLELRARWGGSGALDFSVRWQLRDEAERPLRQDLALESRARF